MFFSSHFWLLSLYNCLPIAVRCEAVWGGGAWMDPSSQFSQTFGRELKTVFHFSVFSISLLARAELRSQHTCRLRQHVFFCFLWVESKTLHMEVIIFGSMSPVPLFECCRDDPVCNDTRLPIGWWPVLMRATLCLYLTHGLRGGSGERRSVQPVFSLVSL